jgi:CubicO group peptidase (beta-lactamase class C family)
MLLCAVIACAAARPARVARVDASLAARLESVRQAHDLPGMGVAVVEGDRISIAVAGRRRVDRDDPILPGDAFHLGSDTKAITASVAARLVERGLLRFDEPLAEALPGIAGMDPAFRTVTLAQLMRHNAGLASGGAFTPEFTAGFDDEHWSLERQRAWMAERFLTRPPATAPGSGFAYSNYGYLLLGHVLERAAGKPWEALVREEVFGPLGMDGCGFGPTATEAHPAGVWGHELKGGRPIPTSDDNPPLIGPAGTVHCPLAAWARFAAAHAGAGPPGWLTQRTLDDLHEGKALAGSPAKDLALGWGVTRTDPPRLTHSGSNGYNVAEIVVVPGRRIAVIVTSNLGDDRARAAVKALAEQLAGERLGRAP